MSDGHLAFGLDQLQYRLLFVELAECASESA
jgi:hypothetical protein